MKIISFRWLFILLGVSFFVAGLGLYFSFNLAKDKIYNKFFEEVKKNIYLLTNNYKNDILLKLPKNENWYEYLKNHPKLQKHLNRDLSMIVLNEVKNIYVLAPIGNKLVVLANSSKSNKSKFGEIFDIKEKNEYFSLKPHYFIYKKSKQTWIAFINPVLVDKKIKAIIVADMPLSFLDYVKYIIYKLQKYLDILLGFIVFAVLFMIMFSYFDEKREKEKEKLLQKLQQSNKILEIKVKEKVDELRKKDLLIMNQGKLVALGEMLNMIAHQWRQPLNALSAAAIHLELKTEMTEVNKEDVIKFTRFVQNEAQKLSTIIDDFMNFAKPNEEIKEFYLKDVIADVLQLIGVQLKNHNIQVDIDIEEDFKLKNYKKVIEHILLNLISNARDALDEANIENKKIKIYTKEKDDTIEIIVFNNGDKITKSVADRMFEPYFTTKEEGKGTGLGLYMSKKLAREKLGGDLYFENREDGVVFILKLRRNK